MILEKTYSQKVGLSHRKKYAQFFTPEEVAEVMIDWILKNESLKKVLEPAFGLGVFSRLLLEKKAHVEIKGFDVDPVIFEEANSSFGEFSNVNLILEDYLFNDWKNKYDGIVCNPPYFKFHDYENKKALEEIKNRLKVNLNGFTNIYTLFLLKSIYQLNEGGKAAYIVPSEFLNSDYGTYVKEYLIKTNTLKHLIIFDFKEKIFDDVLTTSAILLLSKDGASSFVSFSTIENKEQFEAVKAQIKNSKINLSKNLIHTKELDPNIKWRAYYQTRKSLKYKNLIPFKNVAKVVRGIATGANKYFTFNQEKAEKFKIPLDNLLPCITKSKDVDSPFFTSEKFEDLKEAGANIYLFNAGKTPTDAHVLEYIKIGEEEGIDKKFLTSRRKPWFINENRPPSPIWVSVFNRNRVKFIRNEAEISNLTTFHCIYLKSDLFSNVDVDLLFAYLQTSIAREIFSDNRREYGDGLKKFEPNDLNNGLMLNLSILTEQEKGKVKELYFAYRKSVVDNSENEFFIEEIESILKQKYEVEMMPEERLETNKIDTNMNEALKTMIENMPAKTGKSLEEWKAILKEKSFTKHSEGVKFLKSEHGVTHGFANTIVKLSKEEKHTAEDLVELQYKGKESLYPIYEELIKFVKTLGSDVTITPKKSSVSIIRKRQFVLIKPATKSRIDLGFKLKDKPTTDRLQNSGPFGTMCTHRVKLSKVEEVDKELKEWIEEAYEKLK